MAITGIFTIHDAILTYEEYLPGLEAFILEHFYDITGIKVGVKTKFGKPNPEPKWGMWTKNVRHGIFTANIERGAEYLKGPVFRLPGVLRNEVNEVNIRM